jgi:hypothetical protein
LRAITADSGPTRSAWAPPLELENPRQIVALPLGSRVKLDPGARQAGAGKKKVKAAIVTH